MPDIEDLLKLLDDEKALAELCFERYAQSSAKVASRIAADYGMGEDFDAKAWFKEAAPALAFRLRDEAWKYDNEHDTLFYTQACVLVQVWRRPGRRGKKDGTALIDDFMFQIDSQRDIGMGGAPSAFIVAAVVAEVLAGKERP
jgi:hypothetical protein